MYACFLCYLDFSHLNQTLASTQPYYHTRATVAYKANFQNTKPTRFHVTWYIQMPGTSWYSGYIVKGDWPFWVCTSFPPVLSFVLNVVAMPQCADLPPRISTPPHEISHHKKGLRSCDPGALIIHFQSSVSKIFWATTITKLAQSLQLAETKHHAAANGSSQPQIPENKTHFCSAQARDWCSSGIPGTAGTAVSN